MPLRQQSTRSGLQTTPVVFVVDDDESVRDSLESLVRWKGWIAETFTSAKAFLAREPVETASCLVLDVALPDLNGLDVQAKVAAEHRHMPVLFITGCGDVPTSVRAMKAGAAEFLTKPLQADLMVMAIQRALERSRELLAQASARKELQERFASLTRREREVLSGVVAGLLNKQVGAELGMTEATVKAHRGQVMRKMRAESLADLVRIAARLDLPLPDRDSAAASPPLRS